MYIHIYINIYTHLQSAPEAEFLISCSSVSPYAAGLSTAEPLIRWVTHLAKRSANASSVCAGGGGGGALRSCCTRWILASSARDVSVTSSSQREVKWGSSARRRAETPIRDE